MKKSLITRQNVGTYLSDKPYKVKTRKCYKKYWNICFKVIGIAKLLQGQKFAVSRYPHNTKIKFWIPNSEEW